MSIKYKSFCLLRANACLAVMLTVWSCNAPPADGKRNTPRIKHNYTVLLDLSDRLIVQNDQPNRDKQIIKKIYTIFEERVKKDLYIKSRDEVKVVIAPQRGTNLKRDVYEDRLYVNMKNIKHVFRKAGEAKRRETFFNNLDSLYKEAVFSSTPQDYDGADIWKYFYEDLKNDYATDSLTENYLFILTDGYPIVGSNQTKLKGLKKAYPDLHIIIVEASPRDKDLEWDHMMAIWEEWFHEIGIKKYTIIKRGAITKELEQINEIVNH